MKVENLKAYLYQWGLEAPTSLTSYSTPLPTISSTLRIWISKTPPIARNCQDSLVAQLVKNLPAMQETWVRLLGQEGLLEKEIATQSSILAWEIPRTEEPGRLQSMGLQRVGQDLATKLPIIFLSCHNEIMINNEYTRNGKISKKFTKEARAYKGPRGSFSRRPLLYTNLASQSTELF